MHSDSSSTLTKLRLGGWRNVARQPRVPTSFGKSHPSLHSTCPYRLRLPHGQPSLLFLNTVSPLFTRMLPDNLLPRHKHRAGYGCIFPHGVVTFWCETILFMGGIHFLRVGVVTFRRKTFFDRWSSDCFSPQANRFVIESRVEQ